MMLNIAPNFRPLPLDAVTQTFGILAVRGAGKSNAAVVLAEEMHKARLHWVAIDPKGDWWGVRSSGDGAGPGLPVVIFGGLKGDVPLEPSAGAFIADLIVEQSITCVLDVSEFSEAEKIKFLAGAGSQEGFATRLFRKKNRDQEPTHLFCEEADDYIPQKPFREQAKLVHVFQKLVKMGRQKGLGATIISQRSARVNKDVLTQIETLIALRTTSPQDRKAIADWIEYHAQSKSVLESLSSLEDGEAWFWSPHWMKCFERIRFRRRQTFDSGSTPAAGGKRRRAPAMLADVDLAAIKSQMADTIERVKADDPRTLRARIADLERKLAAATLEKPRPERVEVPMLSDRDREAMAGTAESAKSAAEILARCAAQLIELAGLKNGVPPKLVQAPQKMPKKPFISVVIKRPSAAQASPKDKSGSAPLPIGERKVLAAVAQYAGGVSRETLTVLTGYKRSSRDAYLQRLKSQGFVEQCGESIEATESGMAALGDDFEPLPTGHALREYWLARLPEGERVVLGAVIDRFPAAVDRNEIDAQTGYKRSSRDAYLQRLRARRLVEFAGRGEVRASEVLFEG